MSRKPGSFMEWMAGPMLYDRLAAHNNSTSSLGKSKSTSPSTSTGGSNENDNAAGTVEDSVSAEQATGSTEQADSETPQVIDGIPVSTNTKNNDTPSEEFTAEQDTELLKLKIEQGRTWKEIAQAIGKPQWMIKNRFKQVRPQENTENVSATRSSGGYNQDNRANISKKKQKEKTQEEPEAEDILPFPLFEETISPEPVEVKEHENTGEEEFVICEDTEWSLGELEIIANVLKRDYEEKWIRLASKFYDKTGRRVHPRDLRDKVMQLMK